MFKEDKSNNLKKIKQQEKYFIQQKKHSKTLFQHLTEQMRFFIYIFRKHNILFLYATYLQLKLYHSTSNKSMTILTNWLKVLKQ